MSNRVDAYRLGPIALPGPVSVLLLVAIVLLAPLTLSAQSFEVAARFGAGGQPAAVAVGDFNEDSKPDVVVANYGGSSLSVLLGTGTGALGAGTLLSVGSFPLGIVTGDFNGDGHLDLAAANFGSNNVSILLGTGTGTFGPPTSYATGLGPTTLVAADFNADSRLDLAVANFNGGTVSILRGDGSGAFSLVQSPATGAGSRGVAAGNLNGDAFPDLVVANFTDNNVTVLLGSGTGFTAGTPVGAGGAPFAVALAPLNADANVDLVVANSSGNTVSVRFGNGDGTFASASSYATGTEPRWVLATDLNGDTKVDLAVAGFQSNSVTVRLNDGAGGFPGVTLFGAGASAMAVAAADFNADGAKDLVTADTGGNDVAVLRGDGLGGFKAPVGRPVGANPRAIASGDFNGDTKRDLVVANSSGTSVSVLLATTGTGGFASHVTYTTTGSGPRALGVGRFNADANDDVVVALSGANQVALLTGNGTGALSAAPTLFDVGLNPVALVVADFNGDTKSDLAVADFDSGEISILIGNGTGGFAAAVSVAAGVQPNDIAVGDFDADGHPDLAVANFGSGDVSILLGDGVGGFTSAGSVAVGSKPRVLAVADFNEDGWADLAAANEFLTSQRLAVLLGDGEGGFGAPAQYGIPGIPTNLKIADTNGDGHADLAVTNSDADSVSILSGDGTGFFGSAVSFSVGDLPAALAVTDLTGDAKPDIAVVNAQNNNMWLLVNTTIFLKADLELTVDDGQVQTVPGAPITYTLTVTNNGPNPVGTVRLEDDVPAAVLSPLFTPAVGSYDILTGVWSGLTLGTGQSVTMTLEGTVDPLATGSVSNTAAVFPPSGVGDPNLANNTDTDTTILHTLTIGNQTVTEGATAVFTVTLSATSTQVITVNYATADGTAKAGSDYTSTSGTLTFPAGTVTRTISVTTLGDALSETTEAFSVVLTGASGALVTDGGGVGTIVDDDPVPTMTIADASKAEGNSPSSMVITVSLSTASGQTVTADYATAAGTATAGADYTTTTGTLSIPAGSLSGTITVALVGDALNETNETFFVNLSGVAGANLGDGQALCTILDDDSPPQISIDDVQVVEVGAGTDTTAAFTVSLSNPSGQVVTVQYARRDATAVAGSDGDYEVTPASGTLTFPAGTTSELVAVTIHGDAVLESTESFFLDLSAPTHASLAKAHGQAWILDQSPGQRLAFSAPRYMGTEASGKAIVVVQRTGGTTGTVTVDYETSDGTAVAPGDYTASSGTLTFGPGITSRSFMVPIANDTVVDGAVETLLVSLRNPTGGVALGNLSTAQVAITDNDLGGTLAFATATYSVGEGGPQVTLTVRRTSGIASGVSVSYATADGTATAGSDYTQTSGVLNFAAGVLTQTLTIPILEDALAEGDETFTVTLTGPTGGAVLGALSTATVKIVDNETALRFSAPSYTARENGRLATFVVTRSGPTAGTVTVDYATSGGSAQAGTDYTAVAGVLSFAPNVTSRSFTVAIANDTVHEPGETIGVHLSNPTGGRPARRAPRHHPHDHRRRCGRHPAAQHGQLLRHRSQRTGHDHREADGRPGQRRHRELRDLRRLRDRQHPLHAEHGHPDLRRERHHTDLHGAHPARGPGEGSHREPDPLEPRRGRRPGSVVLGRAHHPQRRPRAGVQLGIVQRLRRRSLRYHHREADWPSHPVGERALRDFRRHRPRRRGLHRHVGKPGAPRPGPPEDLLGPDPQRPGRREQRDRQPHADGPRGDGRGRAGVGRPRHRGVDDPRRRPGGGPRGGQLQRQRDGQDGDDHGSALRLDRGHHDGRLRHLQCDRARRPRLLRRRRHPQLRSQRQDQDDQHSHPGRHPERSARDVQPHPQQPFHGRAPGRDHHRRGNHHRQRRARHLRVQLHGLHRERSGPHRDDHRHPQGRDGGRGERRLRGHRGHGCGRPELRRDLGDADLRER